MKADRDHDVSTVAGLIAALSECDPEAEVALRTVEFGEVNCTFTASDIKVRGNTVIVIAELAEVPDNGTFEAGRGHPSNVGAY